MRTTALSWQRLWTLWAGPDDLPAAARPDPGPAHKSTALPFTRVSP